MPGYPVVCLNGKWDAGFDRVYTRAVEVPGLAADPAQITPGTLWYKKTITLPQGAWTHATLILNGARFCPAVYINGDLVSERLGGMAPTVHLLDHPDIKPGAAVLVEIALKSLKDVPACDASRIPDADQWRTNISSGLWDDLFLRFHGPYRIERIIPQADLASDLLSVRWTLTSLESNTLDSGLMLDLQLMDGDGVVLCEVQSRLSDLSGITAMDLHGQCQPWTPEDPKLYQLQVAVKNQDQIVDAVSMPIGLKEFTVAGRGFMLNNKPVKLRAGTVVWHRWLRDPEAKDLAFDEDWFRANIVDRLKSHGANTLRFHLGMPPERFLDLCDKYGLLVQAEWIFFHGMKASEASLLEQWRSWLDLCMRHPSTAIIHAWNETKGEELKTAYRVLDQLLPEYPPMVIGHKDVIHIHKYWWSLFENLGLFYDSANEFDRPIMVDEFGGNYLDGEGNPGGYPRIGESLLRFLGRDHTKTDRLQLHREANGKIAEYWRRIGAAGFSPFCILGSPEDGNHHFMGPLQEAVPKPVWEGLTCAYSPLSCSLEVWDRNYFPGQEVELPLYFFNDTENEELLTAEVQICAAGNHQKILFCKFITCAVKPHSTEIKYINLQLPDDEGDWTFRAMLTSPPASVKHPVVSAWDFRTLNPTVPAQLRKLVIGVPISEPELRQFLAAEGFQVAGLDAQSLDAAVTGQKTWEFMIQDLELKRQLKNLLDRGCSVLMLDAGPRDFYPQGYTQALQGIFTPDHYAKETIDLFDGLQVRFKQMPEPESCIHPSVHPSVLWDDLPPEATRIWNGLRGGLIVPAWDLELAGLGPEDFVKQWAGRGADQAKLTEENYFGYELAGFYAFSTGKDLEVAKQLKAKVRFLVEDAPSLQERINPDAPVKIYQLSELYRQSRNSSIAAVNGLVNAGKGLTRTPVVEVCFQSGAKLILSQLITAGRLAGGSGKKGLYEVRRDPACMQFVINLVKQLTI